MQGPVVGREWAEEGGIYAGLTRNNEHLILAKADLKRDITFANAKAWAKTVSVDGLRFRLPTRIEAALLYANLQNEFEDLWYWCSEDYPQDSKCAWVQTFGYGRQADARKTDACRARVVRVARRD